MRNPKLFATTLLFISLGHVVSIGNVVLLHNAALAQTTDEATVRASDKVVSEKEKQMPPKLLLEKIKGKWEGTCRTWFEPGKLADESQIKGEFVEVLGGKFLKHTYESTMKGKPRQGEELLAFNSVSEIFESSWVDSFHMNYAIMFSEGPAIEKGFAVLGSYAVAKSEPKWGWRTGYQLVDENHLIITAFNVTPDGAEAKAVETDYRRAAK